MENGHEVELVIAWGKWVREGWIRDWPQEQAEVAFRAFVSGWNMRTDPINDVS